MSSNLLSLRMLTQTSSHSSNRPRTHGREADCSERSKRGLQSEIVLPDATVKCALVTP